VTVSQPTVTALIVFTADPAYFRDGLRASGTGYGPGTGYGEVSAVAVVALPLLGVVSRFGYFGVTGLVLVESFGVPAPGETAIIAGAALAGSGRLNIFAVAVAAFLAAVIGDSIGYWIGRAGGRPLVLRFGKYVRLTPARLDRVEQFMARRGPIMVVVARFVEGLRQLNGIVAGVTRMPIPRFVLFNSIGAISAVIHRYQNLALAALVVLVLAYLGYRIRRRRKHHKAGLTAESDSPSPVR
jgi:membrane protein DedA with SNARE-associated domain